MNKKDKYMLIVTLIYDGIMTISAGILFGIWQSSVPAGIFMSIMSFIIFQCAHIIASKR